LWEGTGKKRCSQKLRIKHCGNTYSETRGKIKTAFPGQQSRKEATEGKEELSTSLSVTNATLIKGVPSNRRIKMEGSVEKSNSSSLIGGKRHK